MPSSDWKTPPRAFDFAVEYLRLAAGLLSDSDEAANRSVVSRAYYAAYHCAREKAGIEVRSSPSSHADVWNAIGIRTGKDAPTVKRMGLSCHEGRKTADYAAAVRMDWKATAERAIDASTKIQRMIAGMP